MSSIFVALLFVLLVLCLYYLSKYFKKYKNSLKNKKSLNVVITGGSKGVGYAMTKKFLDLGHKVIICARSSIGVSKAVEKLNNKNVMGTACDVSNPEDVQKFIKFCSEKFDTIDIWINNAGVGQGSSKLQNVPDDLIDTIYNVNLKGAAYCCKYLIPVLEKQENGGHIFLFEGAGSDGRNFPELMVYGSSKYGLSYFTKQLELQLKNTNIGVHAIQPGMVRDKIFGLTNQVVTDMLVGGKDDMPLKSKKALNILAETSEVVADFIVPNVCRIEGTGKAIRFLTFFGILWRFMTYSSRKNRFFDENSGELTTKYD